MSAPGYDGRRPWRPARATGGAAVTPDIITRPTRAPARGDTFLEGPRGANTLHSLASPGCPARDREQQHAQALLAQIAAGVGAGSAGASALRQVAEGQPPPVSRHPARRGTSLPLCRPRTRISANQLGPPAIPRPFFIGRRVDPVAVSRLRRIGLPRRQPKRHSGPPPSGGGAPFVGGEVTSLRC